jgi:hypothetical protein
MPQLPQIGPSEGFQIPGIPEVPAAVGIASGLADVGKALSVVGAGIQRQQMSNSLANGEADFLTGVEGLKTKYETDPKLRLLTGQDYSKAFAIDVGNLQKSVLAQHRDVFPELSTQLTTHRAQALVDSMVTGTNRLHQATIADLNLAGNKYALLALDPAQKDFATTQYNHSLDTAVRNGTLLPQEADAKRIDFTHLVDLGALQQDMITNPGKVLSMSAPPPGITGPEFDAAQHAALEHTTLNYRRVEADLHQQQAVNDDMVLQSITNHTPVPNLDNLRAHNLVSEAVYEMKTGETSTSSFASAPGERARYEKAIEDADPAELKALEEDMHWANRNKSLSNADTADLLLRAHRAGTVKKTTLDVARTHFEDLWTSEFYPPKETGIPTFEVVVPKDNAEKHWKALIADVKTAPKFEEAFEKMRQWMADQKKRGHMDGVGAGAVGRLIPTPTP